MAHCYYCGSEVENDNLVDVDDTCVRGCDDCQKCIDKYGVEVLESEIEKCFEAFGTFLGFEYVDRWNHDKH